MAKKEQSQAKSPPSWLEQALLNPGSVFSNPNQVADNAELSLDEKIRILRSWEYDATEIAVSVEEGMPGPEEEILASIVRTLLRINPGEFNNSTSPTKHHALVSKPL